MVEVLIRRRGDQWVADAPYINITFVGRSRREIGAALRAALRRYLEGPVKIEVKAETNELEHDRGTGRHR